MGDAEEGSGGKGMTIQTISEVGQCEDVRGSGLSRGLVRRGSRGGRAGVSEWLGVVGEGEEEGYRVGARSGG